MNYDSMQTIDVVRDKILVATAEANQGFYETDLKAFVAGYEGGRNIAGKEERYVLTEHGVKQLWQRIGFPYTAASQLSPELQKAVAMDVIDEESDMPLKIATSGTEIDAVFSAEYEPITNGTLAVILGQLVPHARVHRHALAANNRVLNLRLISEEWEVNLGNGQPDPGWGALHIKNNELGEGALTIHHLVARVACFNYVESDREIVRLEHRWRSPQELHTAIVDGLGQMDDVTQAVGKEIKSWRKVPVADPQITFTQIGESAGVPQYAMEDAHQYWVSEGSKRNMFDVGQAISHGLKRVTEDHPSGRPSWDRRNDLERLMWDIGIETREHYEDHGHTQWEECMVCHQPLPEEV